MQRLKKKEYEKRDKAVELPNGQWVGAYIINNKPHIRVTSINDMLFEPFDKEAVADSILEWVKKGKAIAYQGMSKQDIFDQWDNAAQYGTDLHLYIEKYLMGTPISVPKHSKKECRQFRSFLRQTYKKYPDFQCMVECPVYDSKARVAGTIDCMLFDGKNYHLLDWKRTKKIHETSQKYGIHKLTNSMPATSYNKYSIQLNIYAKILRDNYNINVKNRIKLIVFDGSKENYEEVPVDDLSYIVDELFKDFYKRKK